MQHFDPKSIAKSRAESQWYLSERTKRSQVSWRPHSVARLSDLWMSHLSSDFAPPQFPLGLECRVELEQLVKCCLDLPGITHLRFNLLRLWVQNLLPCSAVPVLMSRKPVNTDSPFPTTDSLPHYTCFRTLLCVGQGQAVVACLRKLPTLRLRLHLVRPPSHLLRGWGLSPAWEAWCLQAWCS